MRFVIFLICFLAPLIEADDDGDDPAAINEQLFGKNTFCYFAIAIANDPDVMHQYYSTNAKKYGIGCIDKHRPAFCWNPKLKFAYFTIVPDDTEKVYGTAYLVPVCEYEAIKNNLDMSPDAVKINHSVIKTVEVEKDGKTIKLSCNAFPTIAKPPPKGEQLPFDERPTEDFINELLAAYQKAHLPLDYIEKISKTPTQRC